MRDFKKLQVYTLSRQLSFHIYSVTESYPKHELFGITSQIRRAAVSVVANIAEGSSRFTDRDFAHFIQISLGSISELESLLVLSADLKYINIEFYEKTSKDINTLRKMLINFNKKLRA